jgi:hypothetical protein
VFDRFVKTSDRIPIPYSTKQLLALKPSPYLKQNLGCECDSMQHGSTKTKLGELAEDLGEYILRRQTQLLLILPGRRVIFGMCLAVLIGRFCVCHREGIQTKRIGKRSDVLQKRSASRNLSTESSSTTSPMLHGLP